LFLNDDVLPMPGAVTRLARELLGRVDAVAVGGRLVDPDTLKTQEQYRPRTFPTLMTFMFLLLDIDRFWPGNPVTRRHWGAELPEHAVIEAEQPPGACLLVRKDAFDAIGGFDERYWVWYEDVDILRRLAALGSILWVPAAVFRHLGGSSVGKWKQEDILRSRYQGILVYATAHFDRSGQRVLALVTIAVSVPRIIAFRRSRPEVAAAYRAVMESAVDLLTGRAVRPLVR
jgi:GT2 family glycosyltransferase